MKLFKVSIALLALLFVVLGCGAEAETPQSAASAQTPVQPEQMAAQAKPLEINVLKNSGNPVLEAIAASYSASAFVEGEVADIDIERILTAGAKAPSAKNAQPWHFTVVKNYETASGLLRAAKDGSAVIIISGKRDIVTDTMRYDCGLASAYMQLAAEALGYGARIYIEPVNEIERNQRGTLGIPDGYEVLGALLVAHTVDTVASATPRNSLSGHVNYAP